MAHRWFILILFACLVGALPAQPLDSIPLIRLEQGEQRPVRLKQETRYVAFYFSASWCPPCRTTTPALAEEYQRMLSLETMPVEIVLVGNDRSEKQMLQYIERYQMPWPAIPWHARHHTDPYAARGIPHLALVERASGKLIASGTGSSGDGSIESVVTKIREINGDSQSAPFRTRSPLARFAVLIAIALSVLAILAIIRRRKNSHR